MCLAQMGMSDITVIDYDEVENHNLASQLYKETDIGKPKVEALYDNVKEFTGVELSIFNMKFEPFMVADADIVII
jgi:sulfur carrier protein ThiS adenylyltransferase